MGNRRFFSLLLVAASTLLALVGAEGVLRLWALRPAGTPPPDYGDTWRSDGLGSGGYLRPNLDLEVRDGHGGTVSFVTESHGFRRRGEVDRWPPPETFRLLVLGDSFVAGYRVGQEETFTHRLEAEAVEGAGSRGLQVLPAVIEEPVTGLHYLERHGLGFHPDAVLLGLTLGNDIVQTWAALEPDGSHRWAVPSDEGTGHGAVHRDDTVRVIPNPQARPEELALRARRLELPERCFDPARRRPSHRRSWLDALAERSLLVRRLRELVASRARGTGPQAVVSTWDEYHRPRLLDSNGLGVCLVDPPGEIAAAFRRLEAVLQGYRDLAATHGVELLVALFPQRYEVQPADWQATVDAYGLVPKCFDPSLPSLRVSRICERLRVRCADPTEDLRDVHRRQGESLYLPGGDMHWNASGHRAFALAMRPVLRQLVSAEDAAPAAELATGPQPEPQQR